MDILWEISIVAVFLFIVGLGGIGVLKMLLEHAHDSKSEDEKKKD